MSIIAGRSLSIILLANVRSSLYWNRNSLVLAGLWGFFSLVGRALSDTKKFNSWLGSLVSGLFILPHSLGSDSSLPHKLSLEALLYLENQLPVLFISHFEFGSDYLSSILFIRALNFHCCRIFVRFVATIIDLIPLKRHV